MRAVPGMRSKDTPRERTPPAMTALRQTAPARPVPEGKI